MVIIFSSDAIYEVASVQLRYLFPFCSLSAINWDILVSEVTEIWPHDLSFRLPFSDLQRNS